MAAGRKYPAELRERAVALVFEWRAGHPGERGAMRAVADRLGVHPETLRNWVAWAEVDAGQRPGVSSDAQQRISELEKENRELRRANEILKAASAFFARELDPKLPRSSSS